MGGIVLAAVIDFFATNRAFGVKVHYDAWAARPMNPEMPIEEAVVPPAPDPGPSNRSGGGLRLSVNGKNVGKPGVEQLRENVIDWFDRLGILGDMEQSEVDLVATHWASSITISGLTFLGVPRE
jgi:hypothetical protein